MVQDWMDNLSPEARAQVQTRIQEATTPLQENGVFQSEQTRAESLKDSEYSPDESPTGQPAYRGANFGEADAQTPPRTPNPDYSQQAPTTTELETPEKPSLELSANELQQMEDRKDEPDFYPTENEMTLMAEDYVRNHPEEREAVMGQAEAPEPATSSGDEWKQNLSPDVQAALSGSRDQPRGMDKDNKQEPEKDMDE